MEKIITEVEGRESAYFISRRIFRVGWVVAVTVKFPQKEG